MNESNTITKNQLVTELSRSPHGNLTEYLPMATKGAAQEPEFYAHLVAFNELKGQIRDSKLALPVISLIVPGYPESFVSNSMAHLALLTPRDLLRAIRFYKSLTHDLAHRGKSIGRLVTRYLRFREANYPYWERQAVQFRLSMKELYTLFHVKPAPFADDIVVKGRNYPRGSIFESISKLKDMSPAEAAGTIMERRIPFMTAIVALGAKSKHPDLVLALINRMSPTELVTNSKMLERLGVTTNSALRGAYAEAMEKAGTKKTKSSRTATFKATTAAAKFMMPEEAEEAELVRGDLVRDKLRNLQEKQIAMVKTSAGINGDWLVLGDKSGSMTHAIETSRLVAGTLAKLVTGAVELVFFDTAPRRIEATGKTYDQIVASTAYVTAVGGTSIGCGLQWALDSKRQFDGIAIVSDGGENTMPMFAAVYQEYERRLGVKPVVYWYWVKGALDSEVIMFRQRCQQAGIDLQTFDLRNSSLDHYALSNLAATMRVNRYSLIEEIMETPLLDLDAILPLAKSA